MTKGLCSDSHVARYCLYSKHSDERPMPAAFELRGNEEFLSSNWIEYFDMHDLESNLNKVRDEFEKHHSMKKNGRFAVLNVGDVKNIIEFEHGTKLRIEDLEEEDYPAHAGVWLPPDHFEIALTLSEMVKPGDMYPGTNEA